MFCFVHLSLAHRIKKKRSLEFKSSRLERVAAGGEGHIAETGIMLKAIDVLAHGFDIGAHRRVGREACRAEKGFEIQIRLGHIAGGGELERKHAGAELSVEGAAAFAGKVGGKGDAFGVDKLIDSGGGRLKAKAQP